MTIETLARRPYSPGEAATRALARMPLAEVTTRFVDLNAIPSSRVRQPDSVARDTVLANFGPATIAGYGYDGLVRPIDVVPTETGVSQRFGTNGSALEVAHAVRFGDNRLSGLSLTPQSAEVRGLWTVVKSPYVNVNEGQRHIMTVDLGVDAPPTLIDLPRPILEAKMRTTAAVLSEMSATNGNVVWGNSDSPFSLNGRNLQSVLWPHEHMFDISLVTPENAKAYRKNLDREDNGLAEHFGQTVGPKVEAAIPEIYRQGAKVEADKGGFSLHLPNFEPSRMADPEFIDQFLVPLYETLHEHISDTHNQLFTTPYGDVVDRMNQFRKQGGMSDTEQADYEGMFKLRDVADEKTLPPHMQEMRKLHRAKNLKEPIGVAVGILFAKDGSALLAVSAVHKLDEAFGPAELYGVRVNRVEEPTDLDPELVAEQAARHTTVFHGLRERAILN